MQRAGSHRQRSLAQELQAGSLRQELQPQEQLGLLRRENEELREKLGCDAVIHMDPVVNDERTAALRAQVEQLAHGIDPVLSIHDLRITAGPRHTNVLFDVMVPYGFRPYGSSLTDKQVCAQLEQQIKALSPNYYPVIQVDHSYVEQRENP